MDAATEIGLAVIATSMTLVAVFLPTAFMGGIPGLIFKQFGWTAVFAVLMSLAVARLLTPMLASRFLTHHKGLPEKSRMLDCVPEDRPRWRCNHRHLTFMVAATGILHRLAAADSVAADRTSCRARIGRRPNSASSSRPGRRCRRPDAPSSRCSRLIDDDSRGEGRSSRRSAPACGFMMGPSMGGGSGAGDERKANAVDPSGAGAMNAIGRRRTIENEIRQMLQRVPRRALHARLRRPR